jgi:beta-N-acetylhexosaminidase
MTHRSGGWTADHSTVTSLTVPVAPVRRARTLAALLAAMLVLTTGCALVRPDRATRARLDAGLGQLLLVGFTGTELAGNLELDRLLCEQRVGGVLLFARNIVDAAQLGHLTLAMSERAAECTGRPLLIAVDAEGGRVMRLGPSAGFTPTLSPRELGEANDLAETRLEARRIGTMLRDAGINWNLAPVVDVGYNPANPVIVGSGRSFGGNPRRVAAHAAAWVRGMHDAGVLTALKHFPGHGSSYGDSHLGFVDVTRTANAGVELRPYRALIEAGLADSVMTAHVFNRRLDRRYPATLSRPTIRGLLRRTLGFPGVALTDDLLMGAIEQQYGLSKAAVRAVDAGVDVLLIADDRLPDGRSAAAVAMDALRKAIAKGRLRPRRIDESLGRIAALKARLGDRQSRASTSDRRGSES